MRDEITYPFTIFKVAAVEVWEWVSIFSCNVIINWLSVIRLKENTNVSNYIHNKEWCEITYLFPNLNGTAVEV